MKDNKTQVSRRKFIGTTVSAFAGITVLPSRVVAGLGHKAPSDKLNIAGIRRNNPADEKGLSLII